MIEIPAYLERVDEKAPLTRGDEGLNRTGEEGFNARGCRDNPPWLSFCSMVTFRTGTEACPYKTNPPYPPLVRAEKAMPPQGVFHQPRSGRGAR